MKYRCLTCDKLIEESEFCEKHANGNNCKTCCLSCGWSVKIDE